MTDAATLQILIDVRSRLEELVDSQNKFRQAREEASGFGAMLKTGLGIDVARRGLDLLTNSLRSTVVAAVQMADQLQNTSRNLGISAEALQVLRGAAKEAGAEMPALTQALVQLSRTTIEARDGTGRLSTEFAVLGLNAAVLAEMPLEHQMEAIGRAINNAADQGTAFNAAMQILGTRNAPQLMSMMRRLGRDGFAAVSDEVRRAFGVMSNETVAKLAEAKGKFDALKNMAVVSAGDIMTNAGLDKLAQWSMTAARFSAMFVGQMFEGFGRTAGAMMYGRDTVTWMDEQERLAREKRDSEVRNAATAEGSRLASLNALEMERIEHATVLARVQGAHGMDEDERRRRMERALQKEMRIIEDIMAIRQEELPESGGGVLTEEDLRKVREYNALLQRRHALIAALGALVETPWERSSRAMREVNNPAANPNAVGLGEGLGIGGMDWATGLGSRGEQAARLMQDTLGTTVAGISDGIHGWMTGARDFEDAVLDLGDTALRRLLDTIVEMGVQWLLTGGLAKATLTGISALGSILRKKETAETIAAETAKSGPLMTNAAAASASSFGLSAVIGLALLAALMAAFGGFREHGGDVQPGRAYVVGEKRPELFVPSVPGMILPDLPGASPVGSVSAGTALGGAGGFAGMGGGGSRPLNVAFFGDNLQAAKDWAESQAGETWLYNTLDRSMHRYQQG